MNPFTFPRALLLIALCWVGCTGTPLPAAEPAPLQPDAGGVTLEIPDEGKVETGTLLSISFPAAMVGTESIDVGKLPAPLRFEPALEGTWFWKSQTDGQFTVTGAVSPGQTYTVRLAAGLKDLAGQRVAPAGWGGELKADPFTVESGFDAEDQLRSRPRVEVKFTYPVRLSDAAERIYFQDRDSFERRPAEIGLRQRDAEDGKAEGTVLHVTPREDLPLGRTFDLILDGVAEKSSGRTLPFLRRIPLGTTAPLGVHWVKAMNLPLEKPMIRVRFDDYLDPASVNAGSLTLDPPVANLKVRASDEDLIAEGDFDRTKRYRVAIATGVRGRRGYGLAKPERWGATFEPKRSAVFFPGPRIFQRARLGLNFSFLQVHTGPLAWRLAAVPLEKLPAVQARLREFEAGRKDLVTGKTMSDELGFSVPQPTELLTEAFALPVRANGAFPATEGEAETLRDLRWQPPGGGAVPAGVYLLEITGPAADGSGKTVGHRSLVVFSDAILTQKRNVERVFVRVAGMADGLPQVGVKVRAVSASNFEVAAGTTDRNGIVDFPAPALRPGKTERGGEPATMLVADTAAGPAVGFLDASGLDEVYLPDDPKPRPDQTLRAIILTDRNLYRPGQTVKIKGLARVADRTGERMSIPAGVAVKWTVAQGYGDQPIAHGETTVGAEGGWEAEWNVPEAAKLGGYRLTCSVDELSGDEESTKAIQVQEYKVPLFEVLGEVAEDGGKTAAVKVSARYFSGQPVAGAKVAWRVNWNRQESIEPDPDADKDAPSFTFNDSFSEHAPPAVDEDTLSTKGEGKLGPDGTLPLRADPPPNLPGARYHASWEVAVTSADGQSVSSTQSLVSTLMLQPALLGVTLDEAPTRDRKEGDPRTIKLRTGAFDAKDQPAKVSAVRVEVFRIGTKTTKEQVAPFVYRYRNTSVFNPVKTATLPAASGGELLIPVPAAGRYVATAEAPGLKLVSTELLVDGPGEDEVPVKSETSLEVRAEAKDYAPGQTAALLTRSPVTGVAWVSIETDRILDTILLPLRGNTSRIEFPVKPEYAPNAHVAVYLVRPGADDRLPAERFGSVDLTVRRPDLSLDVKPQFEAASVRPGQEVRGFVQVSSDGGKTPIAGADVTVYAVDDAILALGDWHAPDLFAVFYPHRLHVVKTYSALRDFVSGIERKSLFQKGFIIGGGGEEFGSKFVRKDFKPLAFWKTGLRSDKDGRVAFAFPAPDNLTRYRLVAVAQTRGDQFGLGSETVEIAKPLIVEPSLPRFLRVGDRVELRAVARQSARDRDNIGLSCRAEGITLDGAGSGNTPPKPVAAERNAPAVFRFTGQVGDVPSVTVSFQANGAADPENSADAVETTLPVLPPTILRHEATAGALAATPDLATLLPDDWRRAAGGHYDVAVSTTPDLGRLRALPAILDYPHGCFEQISSRVLAFCAFNDLLAYLPTDPARNAAQRGTIERALRLYDRGVLDDGQLPYWPGGKVGNPFVTVQAAWAVQRAAAAGFDVPSDLGERLDKGMDKILSATGGAGESTMLRAFAFMVRSGAEGAEVDAEVARSIYANREFLGDEGRALLAVALHRGKLMAEEKRQLLREIAPLIAGKTKERAFNPRIFSSTTRAEVMALLAYATVQPDFWKAPERVAARERIGKILERASVNSTQENLWTLFAFHALKNSENPRKLSLPRARSTPPRVSPNGTALEWTENPLGPGFRAPMGFESLPRGAAAPALFYLLNAEYRAVSADEDTRRDRGLRVEKVVRNLTAPARTGQPGAPPVQLNDRLLITYRLQSAKLRDYVALEDELPAGLETINPDLSMFAGFYDLPKPPPGERILDLSSSELKDQKTNLYFDHLDPGVSTYSVLARAVAAGTFRWPATQAGPMYEPAVGGLAPSSLIVIAGE